MNDIALRAAAAVPTMPTPRRRRLRRWIAAIAACAAWSAIAHAQPGAGAAITPPARADAGLRGSVLATRQVADHRACHSECQRTSGCTGYNFNPAAKANCSVLGGTLSDVVARGVVSCRMPCEVSPRVALLSPRQGNAAVALQPAPARLATAGLARGTASASAASFGTGPVSGALPPCPAGRPVVVAGSCSNAAVAVAPPPSSTTITLVPTNDNTIGSSSLSATAENSVHAVNYWFATPGIGMGCNHVFVAGTGVQHLSCARGLIKFNLAVLAGKSIQSATLSLTTSASGTGSYRDPWYVAASASPWAGSSVTWTNYGDQTYTASIGTYNPPAQSGQVFNLDQTATVRSWVSGAYVNNGFAMALSREQLRACNCNSLDAFEFHSHEDASGRGPKLIVTYQ
jgi:hypothetical protein